MVDKKNGHTISKPIVLRCYSWPTKEGFLAECIDLDIIVRRPTARQAYDALNEAVFGHLKAAWEQGWLEELVPRKSPFRRRLLYHLRYLYAALCQLKSAVASSFYSLTATVRDNQLEYA